MLTVKFKTGNAAFEPDAGMEAARILEDVAERLRNGAGSGNVCDRHGNTVGEFRLNTKGA